MEFLKRLVSVAALCVTIFYAQAQNHKLDSIGKVIRSMGAVQPAEKCRLLISKSEIFTKINTDSAIACARFAYSISLKTGLIAYQSISAQLLGYIYYDNTVLDSAAKYEQIALDAARLSKTDSLVVSALTTLGATNRKLGNKDKAIPQFLDALALAEKLGLKKKTEVLYQLLGLYYMGTKAKALGYFQKGLKLSLELNFERDIGLSYTRIANVYMAGQEYDSAQYFIDKSLRFARERKNLVLEKWALDIQSGIYKHYNRLPEALQISKRSIEISRQTADTDGVISSSIDLGGIYRELGQYEKSVKVLLDNIEMIRRNKQELLLNWCYRELKQTYEKMGDFKNAYYTSGKQYEAYKKSMNEKSQEMVKNAEVKYQALEKDKKLEVQKAELEVQKAESKQKEFQRNAFIAGFGVFLLLSIFIFRGYRQKQKANEVIREQKKLVEEKNKDITDSINYARRIQEAILPSKTLKYKLFPEAFVLFQPRDIVSGDFYWFTEKSGKRIIAAIDCTGHGVPGAFMSMIGNAFLNEIINEQGIVSPGQILDHLRDHVISSLKQNDGENKDGMDIALLAFTTDMQTVEYAGANNPLWIVRPGAEKMEEVKADKQPIGRYKGEVKPFATSRVKLEKGDTLYIFTDGYADQFGGPKGKKFKYARLQEMLLSIQGEPMTRQEEILLQKMKDWKGSLEQVDDILLIGIRV